ncbi:MAG: type II toxin-antitoxin system VapC family toxin [Sulfurovum sp.]|nr:type II toxin-antitoxin system VapC family toxin [Sulfurovum sp.]
MATKIYLDTNIILDLFDNERKFSISSQKIIDELFSNGAEFYINSDTLTNTFFILKSCIKVIQEKVLKALEYSTTLCEVVPIEKEDALRAIALCADKSTDYKDYEDAVQYVCAKKIGADMIVTNDKKFVSNDIEICRTVSQE